MGDQARYGSESQHLYRHAGGLSFPQQRHESGLGHAVVDNPDGTARPAENLLKTGARQLGPDDESVRQIRWDAGIRCLAIHVEEGAQAGSDGRLMRDHEEVGLRRFDRRQRAVSRIGRRTGDQLATPCIPIPDELRVAAERVGGTVE